MIRQRFLPLLLFLLWLQLNGCGQEGERKAFHITDEIVLEGNSFDQLFRLARTIELKSQGRRAVGTVNSVSFFGDGSFAVADNASRQILIFDRGGSLLRSLGSFGDGPGEFRRVSGLAALKEGHLLVYDNKLDRITRYDDAGKYLYSFPAPYGAAFAIARDESALFVYDVLVPPRSDRKVVTILDLKGKEMGAFGYQVPSAFVDGIPIGGGGITCSSDGGVFVIHASTYRVKKFSVLGDSISEFGNRPAKYQSLDPPFSFSDTAKLNSFTAASAVDVVEPGVVLVVFVRKQPPVSSLELYTLSGKYLRGNIDLPPHLSSVKATVGDTVYFLETLPETIDRTGVLPNPRLFGYVLVRSKVRT